MIIGCCGNMNTTDPDGTGIEFLEQLCEVGYDYIELSLSHMTSLSEAEFDALRLRLLRSSMQCKACNNFFPPTLRLTGPAIDIEMINRYAENALDRAGQLGVEHVVFGSGPAKRVPDGFPHESAWEQLVDLLRRLQPIAAKNGIVIAIEPLRRAECNIINSVAEGLELVKACDRTNIRLLADLFHMAEEKEPMEAIAATGKYLAHIHIANPTGRVFPKRQDSYDYREFLRSLKEVGYQAKISVEAYTTSFRADAVAALALLRGLS